MSAQPHEPLLAAGPRPEPTIRSVRLALPAEHREAFQAEIERSPLHELARVLADWDLRARALAVPELMAAARRAAEEGTGGRARPQLLSDDEVRALWPAFRP